jgi:hypothetical protein
MRIKLPAYLSTARVAHSYRFRGQLLFLTYFLYFGGKKVNVWITILGHWEIIDQLSVMTENDLRNQPDGRLGGHTERVSNRS